MKKVVVIGGGITGLCTMYYLKKYITDLKESIELTLIEKGEKLGGKIKTVHHGEFIVETGADSMVARHESVTNLVQELQLNDEVVYNATGISYIYTNNQLHPIPAETVFGIPINKDALFSSTLVSEEGKKEALKDFSLRNETFTKDSSIGSFLEYFLGKELVEKQIAPVLSGVYSGDLYELTLATTMPYLLDYKNEYGSIIEGLGANKDKFLRDADKKFMSFQNGLSTIIDRLESELADTTIMKKTEATKICKKENKYEIHLANREKIEADFVVLAIPHQVAQELLNHEQLNHEFNKFHNNSTISIYLGFDIPDKQLPADGTGFIVSQSDDVVCNACTWTSRKWKHTSANGHFLTRLFYKSSNPAYRSLKNMSRDQLVQVALDDIKNSLRLEGEPRIIEVTYWDEAMPQYHLEHNQAIHTLTEKMASEFPNVFLAGCSYFGVGIGSCIENGKEIASLIQSKIN